MMALFSPHLTVISDPVDVTLIASYVGSPFKASTTRYLGFNGLFSSISKWNVLPYKLSDY